jgi:serine/threonine-protein kinase
VYFIAMEYLEGKTLSRVLREEGPFDEERTTHVARQICRSLREAHTLSVVHRDLKPANVYLLQHGDESDVVKVLDFGLVKNVEDGGEDLTQTGLFMGSPKYMSPEQVKGEHVDARADVYALGVMMFEMLTGHVPYEKAKQLDTLLAHVHDPVPSLKDKKPDLQVSETIDSLVTRCLQKNPADRPSGMEEVLAALKIVSGANTMTRSAADAMRASASFTPQPQVSMNSLSGEIPAANPTSIVPLDQPKPGRAKYFVAAAAALLLVVGVGVATRSPKPADAQPTQTQPAAPKAAETPVAKPSAQAPVETVAAPAKVEEHFVEVDSEPPGARVRDEAKSILCDKTPCKVRVEGSISVTVEQDGYGDQKVKLAQNDARHLVKLTKSAVWHPPPAAAKPASTAAPTSTAFKPDPYGSGPY